MKTDKKPKTGGRKRGSRNKATADLRQAITDLIHHNWDTVQADLEELKPVERLAFLEKMMTYTLPRLQTIPAPNSVKDRLETLDDAQLNRLIDQILDAKNA